MTLWWTSHVVPKPTKWWLIIQSVQNLNNKPRYSRSFKVIEVGTNRKPVCDFLLVINTKWHPISYRFGVIAAYFSNFGHCVFEPPFGGLGTTCDVHLRLIGKRVVGFPISVNWTFFAEGYGWGATSENSQKSAICKQIGHHPPNFRIEGDVPEQPFLHGLLGQWTLKDAPKRRPGIVVVCGKAVCRKELCIN